MASKLYDGGMTAILGAGLVLGTDTLKIMLVTTSYTFAQGETAMTNAAAAELSVTGYTPGFASSSRHTVSSKTTATDGTNHRSKFSGQATDTWTALGAGATISAAILYKHLTNDASSTPLVYLDFTDTATNGSDFTLTYDTNGFFYIQN